MDFHDVANIFPMMGDEEYKALVADIKANGLHQPIWTYQGKIIDGRNRYKACREVGIEPQYCEYEGDEASIIPFVLSLNLQRRHLTSSQKGMIATVVEVYLAKEAEKRMLAGKKADPSQKVVQGKSSEQAARLLGTNRQYVIDAKKIIEKAPDLKESVINGLLNISEAKKATQLPESQREKVINKIASGEAKDYKHAVSALKREGKQEIYDSLNVELEDCNLYTCSVANLRHHVEAESLDAIITDPPYAEEYLPIYADLAKFASYALKPGGTLIAMVGHMHEYEIQTMLREHLCYRWTICYYMPGQTAKLFPLELGSAWKPILWFTKGGSEKLDIWKQDMLIGRSPDKRFHDWGQPVEDMVKLVEQFTQPGQLVCDPFVGGGSTAVAALQCKRLFVGCDIDPKYVAKTRDRISEILEPVLFAS
jgi:hypothetical protein